MLEKKKTHTHSPKSSCSHIHHEVPCLHPRRDDAHPVLAQLARVELLHGAHGAVVPPAVDVRDQPEGGQAVEVAALLQAGEAIHVLLKGEKGEEKKVSSAAANNCAVWQLCSIWKPFKFCHFLPLLPNQLSQLSKSTFGTKT